MHVFAILKWTATILLVFISECRGQSSELLRLTNMELALDVLQAKTAELDAKNAVLGAKDAELDAQNADLATRMSLLLEERDNIDPSSGGVVYVRWGRKTCPGNAILLYEGVACGSHYGNTGGGSNYQCVPRNTQWGHHTDGQQTGGTYMELAKYRFWDPPFLKTNYAGDLIENIVPCVVCHVSERHSKVMIPTWRRCPDGWTREYGGYLTSSHYTHNRASFECMDEAPEVTEGATAARNYALFYIVDSFFDGRALTCVVCTK